MPVLHWYGMGYLKICILLCILALGGLFLFVSHLLPAGLYPVVFNVTDTLPTASQASVPYLEKFEGHWSLTFSGSVKDSLSGTCPAFTTTVDGHDGLFSGQAAAAHYFLGIVASSTESGIVAGIFYSGNKYYTGTMSGTVSGAAGSGTWRDNTDCTGRWILQKVAPVRDPAQATVGSLTGRVTRVRGSGLEELWFGELLYTGDIVVVPANGQVILLLGIAKELVTVPSGTRYTVPDVGGISVE